MMAALCCAMSLSATIYTCHLKVNVNGYVTEQDGVQVVVNNNNGTYDLSLNNFVLASGDQSLPVGNIAVSGVEGVDQYGYTTLTYNESVLITEGDDPQYDYWMGTMLGEVPLNLTARFIDTALSANIDIVMGADMIIGVDIFGIAPELKGDVNKDGEVTVADVNAVIKEILNQ